MLLIRLVVCQDYGIKVIRFLNKNEFYDIFNPLTLKLFAQKKLL